MSNTRILLSRPIILLQRNATDHAPLRLFADLGDQGTLTTNWTHLPRTQTSHRSRTVPPQPVKLNRISPTRLTTNTEAIRSPQIPPPPQLRDITALAHNRPSGTQPNPTHTSTPYRAPSKMRIPRAVNLHGKGGSLRGRHAEGREGGREGGR